MGVRGLEEARRRAFAQVTWHCTITLRDSIPDVSRPRRYDEVPLTVALADPEAQAAIDAALVAHFITPIDAWVDTAVKELQDRGAQDTNVQVLRLAVVHRLTEILDEYTKLRAAEALADGVPRVGVAHALGLARGTSLTRALGGLDDMVEACREADATGVGVPVSLAGAPFVVEPNTGAPGNEPTPPAGQAPDHAKSCAVPSAPQMPVHWVPLPSSVRHFATPASATTGRSVRTRAAQKPLETPAP